MTPKDPFSTTSCAILLQIPAAKRFVSIEPIPQEMTEEPFEDYMDYIQRKYKWTARQVKIDCEDGPKQVLGFEAAELALLVAPICAKFGGRYGTVLLRVQAHWNGNMLDGLPVQ